MKQYLLLCCVLLSLCGCVEEVDFRHTDKHRPAVTCILTSDTVQKLTLTYTRSLVQGYYDEIPTAKITMSEADKVIGEFQKSAYAEWELHYRPKAGMTYRLTVQIPGEKDLSATTTFPCNVPVHREKKSDTDRKRYFRKDSTGVFWAFAFEKPEDVFMRPVYIDPKFQLYANISSDYPKIDNFNAAKNDHNGPGKQYFAYLRMLPDERPRRFFLEELHSCVVVFRAVSPEYDQYLKSSIAKMLVYEAFDDPGQWLDESEIYSNIVNGVGIFGAYSDLMFNCNDYLPE